MRFFLLGNANKPQVLEEATRLRDRLLEFGDIVIEDFLQREDLSCETADIALVLGGDGAILRAARQMGYCQTPALGINLGRLGFLADLKVEDLPEVLPHLIAGNYSLTSHLMFECQIVGPRVNQTYLGLNDVVIKTGPPFHMLDLELLVGDEPVARFLGDGILVSTPIGSTAHSMSAGGPILSQELDVFVITPICAHALTFRPLVDSANKEYRIRPQQEQPAWLIVDGQETVQLTPGHQVSIRRAPVAFRLVKVAGRTYFQTLREKLSWGTLPNYRNELPPPG